MSTRVTPGGIPKTSGFSFVDFLKKSIQIKELKKSFVEIVFKVIDDKNRTKILVEIKIIISFLQKEHKKGSQNLRIRTNEFTEEESEKTKENLQIEGEEQEEGEKEEFSLDFINGNVIILYNYFEFQNLKYIPLISMDTQSIINYFTMGSMNKNLEEEQDIVNEESKKIIEVQKNLNDKINDISNRKVVFYKK